VFRRQIRWSDFNQIWRVEQAPAKFIPEQFNFEFEFLSAVTLKGFLVLELGDM
jgi:hypothetical protein